MPRNDLVFVRVVSAEIEKKGRSLLVYALFLRVFYGKEGNMKISRAETPSTKARYTSTKAWYACTKARYA